MRGVKKNKLQKKVSFFFFLKLNFYFNFDFFFVFLRSLTTKFFYFSLLQFFFPKIQLSFFSLSADYISTYIRKSIITRFFKSNEENYEVDDEGSSKNIKQIFLKKKVIIKILETQLSPDKNRTERLLTEDDLISDSDSDLDSDEDSESSTPLDISRCFISPIKNILSVNRVFLHNFVYNYILFSLRAAAFPPLFLIKSTLFIHSIRPTKFKFFNCGLLSFFFQRTVFSKRAASYKIFNVSLDFFFFKKNFLSSKACNSFFLKKEKIESFSLRAQQQFFLKKYFSIFSFFFFYNFIPFGIKFRSSLNINQKLLSSLLFLPDAFLFLNYSGFFIQEDLYFKKYNNIVPLFNIKLNLRFRRKRALPLKNTNIFLWYLLNFFETKLQKPVFLKLLYSRKAIYKKSVYLYCVRVFRKLQRFNFRFKRNFFLGELIRITIISLMSRDSTLFINYITWVLMQIPYKDVKGFLYFLKVFLKKNLLPNFKRFFSVKGFIFDIRGKVGVTGDAKKRHTLISWGQSSFSEKNLKLSLKQGLVYTRTGVMGVTVIIIF